MRWSLAFVPSPFKSVGNYLSLDGQRLFTCISGQRFQLLLLDGSPWALVPKSPRRFRAGPDLGMLVAILGDEGDQTIRVNDDLFGPFDTIDLPAWPNFAAAPKSIAFRFVRRGKVWMHVDGFEFGPYDDADTPTLLDDSAVYRFRRGNEHYVFANGEEYGPFDHIDTRVVAHGGRLAFVAGHGGKSQLWLDGQPTGEYCRRADVAFSDDGQRTAIVYRRNDDHQDEELWRDGKQIANGLRFNPLRDVFSRDGKHFFVSATNAEGRVRLFVDDRRIGPLDYGDGPYDSADGSHRGYLIQPRWKESPQLVLDDRTHNVPGQVDWEYGDSFSVSDDGRRSAMVLRDESSGGSKIFVANADGEDCSFGPGYPRDATATHKLALFAAGGQVLCAYDSIFHAGTVLQHGDQSLGPFSGCDYALDGDGDGVVSYWDVERNELVLSALSELPS